MIEISAPLYVGDVVEMRKPHPCGGKQWEIVRVGANIRLVCQTCKRRVLLPRRDFTAASNALSANGAAAESDA